jgi:ribose 5-phosphate isomerase
MPTIDPKRIAAEKAVEYVQDGMIIGLGTGSTAYWAIQKIGERVKQGLKIHAVASSEQSTHLAGIKYSLFLSTVFNRSILLLMEPMK